MLRNTDVKVGIICTLRKPSGLIDSLPPPQRIGEFVKRLAAVSTYLCEALTADTAEVNED